MYKIAPLILNSGKKSGGAGQIFIAQPDSAKEDVAGKLFILFEAIGKSADLNQVADFLIANLNYYYYENEKISLLGSVKDLKPENIFETALAKTNTEFWEWINNEKLSFNPQEASITAGVVLEKEIHFSSFGHNRIKLVYKKGNGFELADLLKNEAENENSGNKIFSSVISGQLPQDSSFILTNEAFPEYISEENLKEVVSKLPPISAAEQLKNMLSSSNSFVPFLGIIIKSTKLGVENTEKYQNDSASAHSSMNTLNHTEEKTERLLSPIGTINLRKGVKKAGTFFEKFMPRIKEPELTPKNNEIEKDEVNKSPFISPISSNRQKIGISEPMRRRVGSKNNSGLNFNKLFRVFLSSLALGIKNLGKIFNISFWKKIPQNVISWFFSLNLKRRILALILITGSIILLFSLISTGDLNKSREEKKLFEEILVNTKNLENDIDMSLLYGDEERAKSIAQNIKKDFSLLTDKQKEDSAFKELDKRFAAQLSKIEHLTLIEATEVFNFSSIEPGAYPEAIYLLKDFSLYAFDSSTKHSFLYDLKNSESTKTSVAKLDSPIYGANDKNSNVYIFSGKNIGKLNAEQNSIDFSPVDLAEDHIISSFDTYRNFAYLLNSNDGKVYRYTLKAGKYTDAVLRTSSEDANTAAFTIDGDGEIFTVKKNGEIQRYLNSEKQTFTSDSLLPVTNDISKITISGSNIYLVDRQEKRIIVLTLDAKKTRAKFKTQYQFTNLEELKDATISGNTAYLLSAGKIYRAELK